MIYLINVNKTAIRVCACRCLVSQVFKGVLYALPWRKSETIALYIRNRGCPSIVTEEQRPHSIGSSFVLSQQTQNITMLAERWATVDSAGPTLDQSRVCWVVQYSHRKKTGLSEHWTNMDITPANTKHLYTICTTSSKRLRRWSNIVQMLYKCCVFAGTSQETHDKTSILKELIFVS